MSLLPTAANSATAGQVQSRPSSRVCAPRRFTDAVARRSQTALTGSARRGQWISGSKPTCIVVREIHGGPGFNVSRQPTGVGAAVAGAPAGAKASAPRRRRERPGGAALKPYRKFSHGFRRCPASAGRSDHAVHSRATSSMNNGLVNPLRHQLSACTCSGEGCGSVRLVITKPDLRSSSV